MKLPWNKQDVDLEREVAFHLERLADAFEAEGLSRREALIKARKHFGGVEQVKELCRSESRWNWTVTLWQDLRFGWRAMKKSPGISVAAIVSLALGIGATTAIYSFADAVLWRKIAVPNPEQMLEVVWTSKSMADELMTSTSGSNFKEDGMQVADFFSRTGYEAIRDRSAGKLEVAARVDTDSVSTSFRGKVSVSHIRGVSDNFFSVLRVRPFAGHLIGSSEKPDVVLSFQFWERNLNRDPKVLGQTIRINNYPYVITGILPREFYGLMPGDETELYAAISQCPAFLKPDSWIRQHYQDPMTWWLQIIVRRHADVSLEETHQLISTSFAGSWAARPKTAEQTPRIRLMDASTGLGGVRREFGSPAQFLLGLVFLVLLAACANIANLLLARSVEREKEVALRVSLGCSSGRLMRQFLTESLLLAVFGGVLSILVSIGIGALMGRVLPQGLDVSALMAESSFRLIAATAAVTVLTALLFGLYPAWRASRLDASPALKEGSGSAGTLSRTRLIPAQLLVLTQVAIGVLLVMAAIVFTDTLNEIVSRNSGFERAHVLLFDLRPGELGYEQERLQVFHSEAEERLRAVPGVASVALFRTRPMRGGGYHTGIATPGSKKFVQSSVHHVSSDFSAALGVPLIAGRSFTRQEIEAERPVAIISDRIRKQLGLNAPLGGRIMVDDAEHEVIGVARDASYARLTHSNDVAYVPLPRAMDSVTVVMRTRVDPTGVLGSARAAIRKLDPNIPLVDVFTMDQQISRVLQRERLFAWLCGSFGVLALVLCVVGLYGLMSHATARRTAEIGIRMALGATAWKVLRQVAGEGLRLAGLGIALGVPLAIGAANIAQKQRMLPEGPIPYWTLAAAVATLFVSAVLAIFGPALRASLVDPMSALRRG